MWSQQKKDVYAVQPRTMEDIAARAQAAVTKAMQTSQGVYRDNMRRGTFYPEMVARRQQLLQLQMPMFWPPGILRNISGYMFYDTSE
jgi:hypothetical protein